MLKKLFLFIILALLSLTVVSAQEETLPIAEEDFATAELLVAYCFGGIENYYAFLNAESEEAAVAILTEDVGLDEETALEFTADIVLLAETLTEDSTPAEVDSNLYYTVIAWCFGEEVVLTIPEHQDITYYIEYFELSDEEIAYLYYLSEEIAYYQAVELYLLENGVDIADINGFMYFLSDDEAFAAYLEEFGLDISLEDIAALEEEAESLYTEDEEFVEPEEDGEGEEDGGEGEEDGGEGEEGEEEDSEGNFNFTLVA